MAYRHSETHRPLTTGASKGLGLDVQSGNSVLGWIQWGPSQQLGFANVYDCTYEDQGSTLSVIPQDSPTWLFSDWKLGAISSRPVSL